MGSLAAVLVVDDDRMILHTLQEQLSREQRYRVVTTSKVQGALDAVASQEFPIILADQSMPEMPGIELLRKCRDLQPRSSRMLITGMASLPGLQEAVLCGDIFRVLLKPWSRSDLVLALHQGFERHELLSRVESLTA